MPAPFAALDRRVNSAVERALSNAMATYEGGEAFGVQLGREAAQVFGSDAVDSALLTASFSIDHTPGLAQGDELLIDGVAHEVSSGVQPDTSGWVTVNVYPVVV